ncbi:unnamed protein product (macronuclear) [Paramecium tetraurelia]|uniref:Tetratricopeptide repeat protein n=1 Tax=Paramecium tetraurelia TaxID=5888 RepID=A0CGL1_PARTE|nr:uncharacterized protein GSPATT00007368001 [Paramecium tetraurelia]CAK69928.1 unnamed protein product [Paramecium tetraurelia]|eukprot:XP_001437325.1 hypothetical protein (macronuclear) [Paramecium tetraurelia strain d4-2]
MSLEDQKRLDDLFNQVICKAESNNMKFHEFMTFLLERELITAKFNFTFYLNLYQEYFALEEIVQKVTQAPKKGTKEPINIIKDDTPKFSRTKFLRIVDALGKALHQGQKKYLDLILKDIFIDNKKKTQIRMLILDDPNRKLLHEQVIKTIIAYEEDIQALFTMYLPENYYKNELMLTWKEIKLMNLKIPIFSFIQMLQDMNIHPVHYNYENIEDVCMRIIPAITPKENQFYQSNVIQQLCEMINSGKFKPQHYSGDPKISYLEFQFLLCKMGAEITNREVQQDSKKEISPLIIKFFTKMIDLQQNGNRIHEDKTKHLALIKKYYEMLDKTDDILQEQGNPQSEEQDMKQQNYLFLTRKPDQLDIKEIWQFFQQDLPPFPELKSQVDLAQDFVKSIKEKEKREELARKLEEDKKNKNKPQPKQQLKKGEQPMKYQWEPLVQPPRICTYQYFIDFVKKTKQTNPLRDLNELSTLSHITVAPVMLPECLYPHDPPQLVRTMIEASLMSFTQQNYFLAMQNLNSAQELWQSLTELHDAEMVFFEYFGGQIYEIAGQDEAALNKFLRVKFHADKLQADHPDKALPYCGIGSVLYHMQEYELGTRMIRESSIGDENIENAITLNNLGCALHQNGNLFAAENCYMFAITILDIHLGTMHAMTMNVKRNLQKLKANKYCKQ